MNKVKYNLRINPKQVKMIDELKKKHEDKYKIRITKISIIEKAIEQYYKAVTK